MNMNNTGVEQMQKLGQQNMEAAMKSFGEFNKGFQAIAAEMAEFTKKNFEESTATFEKLVGAKTVDQAVEIQTQFAKRAYEDYVAQMQKLGEMYAELAKEAYKPVETAFRKS